MILLIVWTSIALTACTLSYQNISTHGTAQDVVDENQNTSPDIKADATANISAIPRPYGNGPKGSASNPHIVDANGPK